MLNYAWLMLVFPAAGALVISLFGTRLGRRAVGVIAPAMVFLSCGTAVALFAAMLVRARSRDVLLPVLLYPITIPVIIAGVRGTAALLGTEAHIDYFATSLPTMLLFEDDLQQRQDAAANPMLAQARLGLGDAAGARRHLEEVLRRDPNHPRAADLLLQLGGTAISAPPGAA